MTRYIRTFVAAITLLLLVAGVALAAPGTKGEENRSPVAASHQPSESPDAESPESQESDKVADDDELSTDAAGPSEDALQRIVDRLANREIDVDTATLGELAAKYGVGGAVRILAWADATGKDPSEIAALRDEGVGWGKLAQQLHDEDDSWTLSPGNGWVMGHGQGLDKDHPHGPADAPGHNKD